MHWELLRAAGGNEQKMGVASTMFCMSQIIIMHKFITSALGNLLYMCRLCHAKSKAKVTGVCVEDITDQEKTFAHVNVHHGMFQCAQRSTIHLQTLATADI